MPAKKKEKQGGQGLNLEQENILEAVVVADSFNKRFYPTSAKRPRCLFPLANRPLLSYTLEFLASCEVKHVYLYCCHCADQIKAYLSKSKWNKSSSPCKVTPVVSSDFTSVGDVLRDVDQKSLFEANFLLVLGDVVSNVQLKQALDEHTLRREKDRNGPLMTLILRKSSPTHRLRSAEDDIVIAADSTTNRVLHYQQVTSQQKVRFPMSIFHGSERRVDIRYDLIDAGIWICAPQVPPLFTDNFDYQSQADFVKGILINEEFLGKQIHMHVVETSYCARVHNFHSYDVINRDVVLRWTYPFVPEMCSIEDDDNKMLEMESGLGLSRRNVYVHPTCSLQHDTIVQDNTVIGAKTSLGRRCQIVDSVIGTGCTIEDDCVIEGCCLWNNVTVKSGCCLRKSLICDNVTLFENVVLSPGCVVCDEVMLGPRLKLTEGTTVYLHGEDQNDFFEDKTAETKEAVYDVQEVGDKGKGFIYGEPEDDDSDHISAVANKLWGLSLQEQRKFASEREDFGYGESESSSEEEEVDDEHEVEQVEEFDDDLTRFQREVKESLLGGFEEKVQCDNLLLEINSSKYAYNVSMPHIVQTVSKSIVEIASMKSSSAAEFFGNLKAILMYFLPVLLKYVKTSSLQLDCLFSLEECAIDNEVAANCLVKVIKLLYDEDVLSEEAILHWNSRPRNFEGRLSPQQIRLKVAKLIQWFHEAEEEDSDESA